MRALVVSDLHLEFWKENSPMNLFKSSSEPKPDIVILAGDIHNSAKAVKWAAEMFVGIQVLYVMGINVKLRSKHGCGHHLSLGENGWQSMISLGYLSHFYLI